MQYKLLKEAALQELRFDDEDEIVCDRDGMEIRVGDLVQFTDPETEESTAYRVGKINGEIVSLYNDEGECEAFGHECKVLSTTPE